MIIAACDDSSSKKSRKKSYRRRYKKNDSWLDAAWFHDHGQTAVCMNGGSKTSQTRLMI